MRHTEEDDLNKMYTSRTLHLKVIYHNIGCTEVTNLYITKRNILDKGKSKDWSIIAKHS